MYRAVVTDLDGTVVRPDGTVSDATMDAAIRLARTGVPLIAATGRTPAGVSTLDALLPHLAMAVCCGGSVGWTPSTGQVHWLETLPPDSVGQLVGFVTGHLPGAGIAGHDGEQWRMTREYAELRGSTRRGRAVVVSAAELARHPACSVSVCHRTLDSDELITVLAGAGVEPAPTLTYAMRSLVDICPAGVDKSSGVRRALAAFGIAPQEAVAFGDMPNDLAMFAVCGHPVAVGNAHPDVRAAAAAIAACIHDDGFARTLRELRLIEVPELAAAACACAQ